MKVNLMSEGKPKEERVIELLEELVKWTKVTSIPKVREILDELVKSPEEKIAYAFSDGKRTTREVAEIAKTNKNNISKLWRKWVKLGIAEPITASGGNRARSVFCLEDFGIEVPSAAKEPKKENTSSEEKAVSKPNEIQ